MNKIILEDLQKITEVKLKWHNFKNANVLITGASGMIGSYLSRVFLFLNEKFDTNITLFVLVRNKAKLPKDIKENKMTKILEQDVTMPINLDEKIDYIIHAASPASPIIMKDFPVETIKANVLGTYNTLELARKSNSKVYLYISSREVYGQPNENQKTFSENEYGFVDPLNVRSCYPEGKKAAENFCVCYKQEYGLNVKIARPAHIYGPGMSLNDGRVQADFLKNAISHQDILMKSDGSSIRTYTYIADAITAMFYIILKSDDIVYNIGDESSEVSIKDLANTIIEASGKDLKIKMEIDKNQNGCAPFTLGILKNDKIRNLGWKPHYSVKDGFKRTLAFFTEEEKHNERI